MPVPKPVKPRTKPARIATAATAYSRVSDQSTVVKMSARDCKGAIGERSG